nr:kallikrein-11 isoform X1 [Chlorocebus sabaeus]
MAGKGGFGGRRGRGWKRSDVSSPSKVSLTSPNHVSPDLSSSNYRLSHRSRYIVHLGEHNLQKQDGCEQTRIATESFPHPGFNNSLPNKDHRNDIMLVKMASPAFITWAVRPLTLSSRCVTAGTSCLISGWGSTSSPQLRLPHSLRCANITIIEHQKCENAYPGNITDTMVCASVQEGGKDSCQVSGQGLGLQPHPHPIPSFNDIFTDIHNLIPNLNPPPPATPNPSLPLFPFLISAQTSAPSSFPAPTSPNSFLSLTPSFIPPIIPALSPNLSPFPVPPHPQPRPHS